MATVAENKIQAKSQVESQIEPQIEMQWRFQLKDEFSKEYMQNLKKFLQKEYSQGKTIYPRKSQYFYALNACPFDSVKVVILGQDPYHGPNQAHGLCFSVKAGVRFPPSLQNIFKELKNDLGFEAPQSGCLDAWAQQGVLLLNSVLTVEMGKAASHAKKGWELFTDRLIQILNEEKEGLVFILWGSYAQSKGSVIDRKKHFVIESPHPSPLSSHRGFFGSKPFSKTNSYLVSKGKTPIHWDLKPI